MVNAVAIYACASPFKAIEVANAFAQARGGRVATLPDLFRLFQAQPDHPLFKHFVLADSVLMVGCERRKRGKYPRTHLVHGAGFLANPNLRAWYDENRKSQTVHEHTKNRALRLSREIWKDYRDRRTSFRIRSRTENWWPGVRWKIASVRDSLDTQQRSLIGEGYQAFIEARRQTLSKPPEDPKDKTRFLHHAWRRGEVDGFEFQDSRLLSPEFRRGDFALASPLRFAVHKPRNDGGREHITIHSWESTAEYVLAISADWKPSAPIFVEDRLELKQWMVGREDCFHPGESMLADSSKPFLLEPRKGVPGQYLAYSDLDFMYLRPPQGLVEVDSVLGEVIIPELRFGDTLTAEEIDALKPTMPVGTQALLVCLERATTEAVGLDPKTFTVYKNVPVQFVRVRPCHEGRYLTHNELFADPNEYLRRIGVGL